MDLPSRLLSLLACLALTGVASAGVPTLTAITPIDGEKEDTPTAVTYAKLAAAANASASAKAKPIPDRSAKLHALHFM